MNTLFEKLKAKVSETKNPLVIFDLDGTLFDVIHRSIEIVKRFTLDAEVQNEYPELLEKVKKLNYEHYKYSLEQTLNGIGIDRYSEHAGRFLQRAENFWYNHFFKSELLNADLPYEGASRLVNWLHDQNVKIVYLSGRDIPNMSQGTIASLEKHGFPVHTPLISMVLKPAYGMDDLKFKKESLDLIRGYGNVIATFDNEPLNVEMFANEFPEALNIHFYTQFARDVELTHQSISVIRNFPEFYNPLNRKPV